MPRTGGAPERADRIVGSPGAAVKAGARLTVILSRSLRSRLNAAEDLLFGTTLQLLGLIVNPSPTNSVDG